MNGEMLKSQVLFMLIYIVNKRKEKERAQLNEIDILDYVESMQKYVKTCYVNNIYKIKPLMN